MAGITRQRKQLINQLCGNRLGRQGLREKSNSGGTTSPYRFHATLVVEKAGYKPVTKIFFHDKVAHEAIIILVPSEAKESENPKLKN